MAWQAGCSLWSRRPTHRPLGWGGKAQDSWHTAQEEGRFQEALALPDAL